MQRLAAILIIFLGLLTSVAQAGTYTLTDGTKMTGDPIGYNQEGVKIKTGPETYSNRIAWSQFTQESLKQLRDDAKSPQDKAILDPLIENLPSENAKRREIVVQPIQPPPRPTAKDGTLGLMAIFSSPLGWTLLLAVYAANLFAAYEVAIFRAQPVSKVCGLAAIPFFGVASPIFFLSMPNRVVNAPPPPPPTAPVAVPTAAPFMPETPAATNPAAAAAAAVGTSPVSASVPAAAAAVAAPALPEPVVYRRGDFAFNRRFFETKLTGFFRLVPSEADKDMLIYIQSGRGSFIGKRITKVTSTELYLQTFKNDASSDEMIPFTEITEVQVRHKDLA